MNIHHARRYAVATIRYLYEFVDKWSAGIGGVGFVSAGLALTTSDEPGWLKTCSGWASLIALGLLCLSLLIRKKQLTAIYQDALKVSTTAAATYARRRLDAYLYYGPQFNIKAATDFALAAKTDLNKELFAGSDWDTDDDSRLSRNHAVLSKNPNCIGIEVNAKGEPHLFSYVIPLSPLGEALYMAGSLADLDFDGSHVAAPDDTYDAILIFALGRAGRRNAGKGLTTFVTDHLCWMAAQARANGELRPIRLIAQTDMGSLARLMGELGFRLSHQKSKDGRRLVTYHLT